MRLALFTGFVLAGIASFGSDAVAQQSNTISAEVIQTQPVEMGRRSPVQLRLTNKKTGAPITLDQLDVVHTKPVHLFR